MTIAEMIDSYPPSGDTLAAFFCGKGSVYLGHAASYADVDALLLQHSMTATYVSAAECQPYGQRCFVAHN